ncbi:MAG: MCE family protein [Alphaproteobacteria bacterium]|nr:MCE family protein [Alphaproteobacteria bacterium]
MKRSMVETLLGAVVVIVAAGFLIFALQATEVGAVDGLSMKARFLKVGGLEVGSDVRISGVKVGTVTDRILDTNSFEAVVLFTVSAAVQLPTDTQAVVTSEGLLGNKYLRLIPGNAKEFVGDGGEISQTRDFRSLEDTVSEIIFLATEE